MVEYQNPDGSSTPFNMASNTLERISNILQEISYMDQSSYPNYAIYCFEKLKKARDLFLASVPLINNKKLQGQLKKHLNLLNGCFRTSYNVTTSSRRKGFLNCLNGTDGRIDDFLEKIQEVLQSEKYFMPIDEEEL